MPSLSYSLREPGVTYEKLPNPKQLLIPGGVAEVAFVGKSKVTKTIEDEEITRAANGTAGKSVSGLSAGITTVGTETLFVNINADGAQTITLAANITGAAIAADIQTKVRALTPVDPAKAAAYTAFTATFSGAAPDQYTLTSGTLGDGSLVVISGGTGTVLLKLGIAGGGTETAGDSGADVLAAATVTSITSIYDENGVNYYVTSDFILTGNTVDWSPDGNEPLPGTKYYVTYESPKAGTDFDVKIVYSLSEAEQEYGSHEVSSNELAVAAYFFFLNGGTKLSIVQVSGTTQADFLAAMDKLAVDDFDVIVALQSNGIGFETLFSQIKARIFQLSQPLEARERMAMVCPVAGTSISQYKTIAQALNYQRMVITAPSTVKATLSSTQETLSGYFYNAAAAGFLANPDYVISEPLTRKEMFGFDDVGIKYTRSQTRDLISSGIMIVENAASVIRVVHGITTDMTSVDRNEISLVRVGDFFGKTLRTVLDKVYIGTRLDPATLSSIRTTITTIVDNFVAKGVLVTAADLSVKQNTLNPTAVDVFMRVQPVYPLNFIDIQFTLELL